MTNTDSAHEPLLLDVRETGVYLGGESLFTEDQSSLLAELEARIGSGKSRLVVTPNVDQVLNLQRNPEFRSVYSRADIRTIDGMPLVALARVKGAKNVHRNTGADLLPLLSQLSAAKGLRLAIVGGRDEVAGAAIERLTNLHPGLDARAIPIPAIADVSDLSSIDVIRSLTEFQPSFVFLCLGAPKQELWFAHWESKLPLATYIAAGAAVDFAAGQVKRAPRWMQKAGLEWVYRLVREPRRLAHRYLVDGPGFLLVIVRSLKG